MEKSPRSRRSPASIARSEPITGKESGDDESGSSRRRRKPGPIYDTAFRALIEADPAAACRLLGIQVERPIKVLHSIFVTRRLEPDLLLRTGPRTLDHFEYLDRVRHGGKKTDLITRMLDYRASIMRSYPKDTLRQHIVVLGTGRVRGHDNLVRRGFALDLHIVYLPKMEPERFLAEPSLAALASLARGNAAVRARAYAQAIAQALATGGELGTELIDHATMVATKNLDPNTMNQIYEEATMTVRTMEELAEIFRDNTFVRSERDKSFAEGRQGGREEGREELLAILLQERFGDDPDVRTVARRLGGWLNPAAALHAISAASSLTDLKD